MRAYYRLMLGAKSAFAQECFAGGFVGVDFLPTTDLTQRLPEEWRKFNAEFIPLFQTENPGKSRISAGLACGALWTVSKGMQRGDIVLCPDGLGKYRVGEIQGDYEFSPGKVLPHRRSVAWLNAIVDRLAMSDPLKNSTGSIGTVGNISGYAGEIDRLIGSETAPQLISSDPSVESPVAFALESHLEEFLVENWAHTELGKKYDIYEEDGSRVGQQFQTDTGPLDILAISKDKKELLVVELKKGRTSDAVVGQTLRYMGFVKEELAEPGQQVRGLIIALEEDKRIRRALEMVTSVDFFRYELSFKLVKA